MKKVIIVAVLMVVAAAFSFTACESDKEVFKSSDEWVAKARQNVKPIEMDTLEAKIERYDEFYLVDVREPMEYYPAYIPSAVNIPNGVLIFKMDSDAFWESNFLYTPKKDDEIVVYCKKGKRSILAADKLRKLGYTNVRFVPGGWMEWENQNPTLYEAQLDKMSGGNHEEVGGC